MRRSPRLASAPFSARDRFGSCCFGSPHSNFKTSLGGAPPHETFSTPRPGARGNRGAFWTERARHFGTGFLGLGFGFVSHHWAFRPQAGARAAWASVFRCQAQSRGPLKDGWCSFRFASNTCRPQPRACRLPGWPVHIAGRAALPRMAASQEAKTRSRQRKYFAHFFLLFSGGGFSGNTDSPHGPGNKGARGFGRRELRGCFRGRELLRPMPFYVREKEYLKLYGGRLNFLYASSCFSLDICRFCEFAD